MIIVRYGNKKGFMFIIIKLNVNFNYIFQWFELKQFVTHWCIKHKLFCGK